MPFWRFLLFSAVGSILWTAALALIGHALGQHWESVSAGIRKYDVVIAAVVVILIAFAVYKRATASRGHEPAEEDLQRAESGR
jgi:membrane protein DedA with SNARE-associated domain